MGVRALGVGKGELTALRRFWPLLFLLLVVVVSLYRVVFLGETIGAFDQIRQMAPWNGPPPSQPWDVLQADGVLQFYPWRDLVLDAWGKGQLPLWNPYELAGTPLLANSQSAGFYPPHIVLGLLHVPTPTAINLLAFFHLFWAGLGVYRLVRELGGTEIGGAVAGASFASSAFMLAWAPLASVISTVAWVPWTLASVFGVFRNHPSAQMWDRAGGIAGTWHEAPTHEEAERALSEARTRYEAEDRRRYLLSVTSLAASVGMMLLAGHLQFAA